MIIHRNLSKMKKKISQFVYKETIERESSGEFNNTCYECLGLRGIVNVLPRANIFLFASIVIVIFYKLLHPLRIKDRKNQIYSVNIKSQEVISRKCIKQVGNIFVFFFSSWWN